MQGRDHLLEFANGIVRGRICPMRSKETYAVITPVVTATALQQERLGQKGVHRQQFDTGDPERLEISYRHRVRQTGKGAAKLRGIPAMAAVKP